MSNAPLGIIRLDLPLSPEFDSILRSDPGVRLSVHAVDDPEDSIWATLSRVQAYHVSSAKNELPCQWSVDSALLARCPDLLCISTYGAGYDTVDVAACTQAGV